MQTGAEYAAPLPRRNGMKAGRGWRLLGRSSQRGRADGAGKILKLSSFFENERGGASEEMVL